MDEAAADRIFGDQDLLAEILARLPSARQVLRTKAVGKKFKSATEEGRFVEQYVEHHQPSIISFLVKFEGVFGPSFQLYDAEAAPADDTVVALRARINKEALQADRVVAARGGFVLRANWIHPGNYTVSCPTDVPRLYTFAATPLPPVPRLPDQYTDNTYGQFGLVLEAGPPGGMAFFKLDLDEDRQVARTCEGVSLGSRKCVHAHVSIYSHGQWNRYFSEPIRSRGRVFFHRHPSCILAPNSLFLVYVVGSIIRFDLTDHTFHVLPMPALLSAGVSSDFQYAVGEHSEGGITLAHFMQSHLYTWALKPNAGALNWHIVSVIDIVQAFILQFGVGFCVNFFPAMVGNDPGIEIEFHSVQPRAMSLDGSLVLLTVAFTNGLFVLDSATGSITPLAQIDPIAPVANVYTLTEPWPPRFV
ncbi:uncharacterized protein [Lolium perenne]|uniref:uncharacterized protein n=1 Tax=Lolium perenne TaxID=4522 RepID=UPI003A998621